MDVLYARIFRSLRTLSAAGGSCASCTAVRIVLGPCGVASQQGHSRAMPGGAVTPPPSAPRPVCRMHFAGSG